MCTFLPLGDDLTPPLAGHLTRPSTPRATARDTTGNTRSTPCSSTPRRSGTARPTQPTACIPPPPSPPRSSRKIRAYLRRRGIPHTIPERSDQKANRRNRGRHGGRPPAFNKQLYRHRNVVERCFNRLKQYRAIATRYDKTRESYEAAVTIASLLLWIRPL
ncbi:transposase [Streptomyces sp. NPDC005262]|uniref:transposase n=1 Tax=Streptomyces sp. NPDC005262 TaxID=3364710 RepID=UPI00367DE0A7